MSKQTGKSAVATSFSDIGKVAKAPIIKIVALPKQFITPEELSEGKTALELAAENLRRKRVAQAAEERELLDSVNAYTLWMVDIGLPHMADINRYVAELGPEYLQEEYIQPEETESTEKGEEAEEEGEKKIFTIGDRLHEIRKEIDTYLACGDPRVTLPLEATEIAFWISSKDMNRKELEAKMRQLCNEKENVLVSQTRYGEIEVLSRYYSFHSRFNQVKDPLKTEVKSKIREALGNQEKRIRGEEEQTAAAKSAEIKAKTAQFITSSDLKILEAMDTDKTGKCAGIVPGGAIWFEVSEEYIELLDATGTPENGFADMVRIEADYPGEKIRIARKSLAKDGVLAKSKDFTKVEIPLEVSKGTEDGEKWIAAATFVWSIVRQAINLALTRQRKNSEGLLPKEFHEGELGKYRPDTEGFVFNFLPDPKNRQVKEEIPFSGAGIEVERFENQPGETRLRVIAFNPEFKEALEKTGCLEPGGFPEGHHYDGCKHCLKLMLQSDFGRKMRRFPQNPAPKNDHDAQKIDGQTAKPTEDTRVANVCADLTRVQ